MAPDIENICRIPANDYRKNGEMRKAHFIIPNELTDLGSDYQRMKG